MNYLNAIENPDYPAFHLGLAWDRSRLAMLAILPSRVASRLPPDDSPPCLSDTGGAIESVFLAQGLWSRN